MDVNTVGDHIASFSRKLCLLGYQLEIPDAPPECAAFTFTVAETIICHYINHFTGSSLDEDRSAQGLLAICRGTIDNDELPLILEYRNSTKERFEKYHAQFSSREMSEREKYLIAYAATAMDSVYAQARAYGIPKPALKRTDYIKTISDELSVLDHDFGFPPVTRQKQPPDVPAVPQTKPNMTFGKFIKLCLIGLGIGFVWYLFERK